MPNPPLILTDNLFENVVLHPSFALTNSGNDDIAGQEVWRIADNLRDESSWNPSTLNAARNIIVDCLTVQGPTMVVIDRGHNLAGKIVTIRGATDATLVTGADLATSTIPAVAGGLPGDANGCLTTDGVWWKTFAAQNFRAWALKLPAMGAGIAPKVTGLYLGVGYRFPEFLDAPGAYDYRTKVVFQRNEMSKGGVRSTSRPLNFRQLRLQLQMDSAAYPGFDAEVRRMSNYGAPMWFCLDDTDATLAGECRLFQFASDIEYEPAVNPVHREITGLDLEEVIPTLYR
jgi:hypothetical protein